MTRGRLSRGLAAAVALGTAAAVPTVVAFSEDPQALARPPQGPSSGSGGGAPPAADYPGANTAGAAGASEPWPLSLALQEALEQLRRLAVGCLVGGEDGQDGSSSSGGTEEAAFENAVFEPAAHAGNGLAAEHATAVDSAGPHRMQHPQQQPSSRRAGRRRLERPAEVPASHLAARHPEEVQQMRQLAVAELARLLLEAEPIAAPPTPQPMQRQTRWQQQRRSKQVGAVAAAEAGGAERADSAAAPEADTDAAAPGNAASAAQPPAAAAHQAVPLLAAATAQQQAEQQAQAQQQQQQQQQQQAEQQAPEPALAPRITDAELMRFAVMHGLLRAATAGQREAALRQGAAAAARTALWLRQHPFSSEEELRRYGHLVSWQGTDAEGRPVLRVAIGRAVSECRGGAALAFANAIITLMERGVSEMEACAREGDSSSSSCGSSSSGSSGSGVPGATAPPAAPACAAGGSGATLPGGHSGGSSDRPVERVVVLMDCTGASALSATRISWVFQAVASTLAHHYPGRLEELVLLDLPKVLSWMVAGVKKLVHPDTRHKFRVLQAAQWQQAQQRTAAQQQAPPPQRPGGEEQGPQQAAEQAAPQPPEAQEEQQVTQQEASPEQQQQQQQQHRTRRRRRKPRAAAQEQQPQPQTPLQQDTGGSERPQQTGERSNGLPQEPQTPWPLQEQQGESLKQPNPRQQDGS